MKNTNVENKNAAAATTMAPTAPTFKFTDEQIREAVAKREAAKAKAKAYRLTPEGKAEREAARVLNAAKRDAMKAHAKKLGLVF